MEPLLAYMMPVHFQKRHWFCLAHAAPHDFVSGAYSWEWSLIWWDLPSAGKTGLHRVSGFCPSCQQRHCLFKDEYTANSLKGKDSISVKRKRQVCLPHSIEKMTPSKASQAGWLASHYKRWGFPKHGVPQLWHQPAAWAASTGRFHGDLRSQGNCCLSRELTLLLCCKDLCLGPGASCLLPAFTNQWQANLLAC